VETRCATPPGRGVLDEPRPFDAGLRQLRRKLSLRRRQDLVVGLRDGDVRDDLVEPPPYGGYSGNASARASVISMNGSRGSGRIEEPRESRRLASAVSNGRERGDQLTLSSVRAA